MIDSRYRVGVGGLDPDKTGDFMRAAIADVQERFGKCAGTPSFPSIGVAIFAFVGDGNGVAYISNAQRADFIKALRGWLAKVDPKGN